MDLPQLVGDDLPKVVGIKSMPPKFSEHWLEELAGLLLRGQEAYDVQIVRGLDHDQKVASCYLCVNKSLSRESATRARVRS